MSTTQRLKSHSVKLAAIHHSGALSRCKYLNLWHQLQVGRLHFSVHRGAWAARGGGGELLSAPYARCRPTVNAGSATATIRRVSEHASINCDDEPKVVQQHIEHQPDPNLISKTTCNPGSLSHSIPPHCHGASVQSDLINMDDDFDSGDDLFDNVNADELVTQNKRPASQGDTANGSDGKRQRLDLIGVGQKLLQEKFGYDKFRHEQEGAIGSVLRGENTLVVFPTGAGKSLCYQVRITPNQ